MLTSQDDSAVQMLFGAIVKVMKHSGMSQAQIYEALKGLVNNWWIDSTWHVCGAFARDWFEMMFV